MSLGIYSRFLRRGGPHSPTIIDGMPIIPSAGEGHMVTSGGSLAQAVRGARSGDAIFVAPGQYDELITIDKSLTIVGLGGRGAAFVERDTALAEGMLVTADDVTLINIGVAGASGADYSLKVAADRFRAYQCKLEGNEAAGGAQLLLAGAGDLLLSDCEVCWGVNGILALAGGPDPSTQIFVDRCRFHNLSAVHVSDGANSFNNIQLVDSVFDKAEDGTEPTDYLLIDSASSFGLVTGCRFAIATNASAKLTIGAGIMWISNATEAGWSTARPA